MSEDWLERGLRDAAAKRSWDRTKGLKPKVDLPAADLSKVEWCGTCQYPKKGGICYHCLDEKAAEAEWILKAEKAIGGRRAWVHYTEKNFIVTDCNAKALAAAKAFNPAENNLFLHGPRGTGKSHLAAIAKRPYIYNGRIVTTVSMPNVIDEMIANMKSPKFGNDWVKTLINAPILSIEDVGAGEKTSEFTVKLYFRIIDGRYLDDRKGLIITTNYSLVELERMWKRFDEPGRIVSRLKEMCVVRSTVGERDWRAEGR